MFKRISIFIYGVVSYAIFFATFLYLIAFVGNLPFVPTTIDGQPRLPSGTALAIDLLLLAVFAVQHSLMARPAFKHWWTQWVPVEAERSTYVLFSSLALILLCTYWQPIGGVFWTVENPIGRGLLYGVFAFGWGLVLYSTFLINHFDLFGLRQVWLQLRGRPYQSLAFKTPVVYRIVRHPLYVGWFIAFWATPDMTMTHALFALLLTTYILSAIQLEEGDLQAEHPEYADYRREVPMLVPRFSRRRKSLLKDEPAA
ncbi:isoprenylcysteine carboxylmethyltransferase family protein [Pseudomonas cavernae]|uniref:methanethiol S-methyltransferase n=1 Tax=Pseudomonas cavernae TaxID=2320867 RepID=A0A385Z3W2_9PSED|nr:methanethiol S-methyltransferase [Pseudomonas cavernae]AYC33381.1 isoprenylcysteine carboxylmethyltransferase family protein [Pseudomonas cavernae]